MRLRPFCTSVARSNPCTTIRRAYCTHWIASRSAAMSGLKLRLLFNPVAHAHFARLARLGPLTLRRNSARPPYAVIAEAVIGGEGAAGAEPDARTPARRRRSLPSPTINPGLLPKSVALVSGGCGAREPKWWRATSPGSSKRKACSPETSAVPSPSSLREGVSRALLREAVRLLEHHRDRLECGAARAVFFVLAPSADVVTHTAAIDLARQWIRLTELAEMLVTCLQVALADLAAERIDNGARGGVAGGLGRREHASRRGARAGAGDDLHVVVAAGRAERWDLSSWRWYYLAQPAGPDAAPGPEGTGTDQS